MRTVHIVYQETSTHDDDGPVTYKNVVYASFTESKAEQFITDQQKLPRHKRAYGHLWTDEIVVED